jgi:beta-lactamase superfamily II metal-dependent hydrolase
MTQRAQLTVRMYDVGFGDCFLVTAVDGSRDWRMLVDCGRHPASTRGHPLDEVVADIVATCTGPEGPRIDVVVASQRHGDHVAGFADLRWGSVEVGEVWLPGVEAVDSTVDQQAMNTLLTGFAGAPQRRLLVADTGALASRPLPGLDGGIAHVLGPWRPEDDLALSAESAAPDNQGDGQPFASVFRVEVAEFERRFESLAPSAALVTSLDPGSGKSMLPAAAAFDGSVHGSCLVLMVGIGGAYVLFAGDARGRTWTTLLDDPDTRKLVSLTDVYKVAHHGSRVGTPKALASLFRKGVVAVLAGGELSIDTGFPDADLLAVLGAVTFRESDDPDLPQVTRDPNGLWLEVVIGA